MAASRLTAGLAHLRKVRSILTPVLPSLEALLRPIPALVPWIAVICLYAALLASSQGLDVVQAYRDGSYQPLALVLALGITWFLMASGPLLTVILLSRWTTEPVGVVEQVPAFLRVAVNSGWVAVLSTAMPLLFAKRTASSTAILSTTVLTLITVAATGWSFTAALRRRRSLPRLVTWLYEHRMSCALLGAGVAIAPIAAGAHIAQSEPMLFAELGPLLVVMVGLAAIATVAGIAVVVIPLAFRSPWLACIPITVAVIWTLHAPRRVELDNPLLRDAAKVAYDAHSSDDSCSTPDDLDIAIDDRVVPSNEAPTTDSTESAEPTVYLVSAAGGGIRAAYWTALNLELLDIQTHGRFSAQVASLSGVSGGSLGIVTWLAARDRQDLTPDERLNLLARYLNSDFLSPLAAGLLFLDAPRLLFGPMWPAATRGQVFEKALADQWLEIGKSDFFVRPYFALCLHGFKTAPALFLNSTDAQTGAFVALSTSPLSSTSAESPLSFADYEWEETSIQDATVAQVVHLSARFPYVSSPGAIGVDSTLGKREDAFELFERSPERAANTLWLRKLLLVDGGYFDNTGLTPTLTALSLIADEQKNEGGEPAAYRRTHVRLVHLSNDPAGWCTPVPPHWRERLSDKARKLFAKQSNAPICNEEIVGVEQSLQSGYLDELAAPFQALLGARTAHSRKTLSAFERRPELPANHHFLHFSLGITLQYAQNPVFPVTDQSLDVLGIGPVDVGQPSTRLLEQKAEYLRRHSRESWSQTRRDRYLADVAAWQAALTRQAEVTVCGDPNAVVPPPLGWTLSVDQQRLIRCLAFRAQIERGPTENLWVDWAQSTEKGPVESHHDEIDYRAESDEESAPTSRVAQQEPMDEQGNEEPSIIDGQVDGEQEGGEGTDNQWGAIFSFDAQSLADFMVGVHLGAVSSEPNASTGVRFRGKVDRTSGTGSIDLLVWDDKADREHPHYWTVSVKSAVIDEEYAIVTTTDVAGSLTFAGRFEGEAWKGTVDFQNNRQAGGKGGSLGEFGIATCSVFVCEP